MVKKFSGSQFVPKRTNIMTSGGANFEIPNHSGLASHPESKKNFVPYIDANKDVDIGLWEFACGNLEITPRELTDPDFTSTTLFCRCRPKVNTVGFTSDMLSDSKGFGWSVDLRGANDIQGGFIIQNQAGDTQANGSNYQEGFMILDNLSADCTMDLLKINNKNGSDSTCIAMNGERTNLMFQEFDYPIFEIGYDGSESTPNNIMTIKTASTGNISGIDTTNMTFYQDGTISYQGIFGEIHVADGTTAQAIATGTTYTKLTAFDSNGESSNCTPDQANDKITITKTGRYLVNNSISCSSGTNNVTFKFAVFLDGNEEHQVHTHRKFASANDMGSSCGSGIINVTSVPVDVDVRARHDNGGSVNLVPSYMNLNVSYIGA